MTKDIYWIYDIPTWQLGTAIVCIYLFISLSGLLLLRGWIYRTFDVSAETNEMTNGIFSGVGVLYGLLRRGSRFIALKEPAPLLRPELLAGGILRLFDGELRNSIHGVPNF